MKMKITPEQYKAVQSYINYMKDLVVNPSVKNARFQLVGSPSNTLQRASIKKPKSPIAMLPPPTAFPSSAKATVQNATSNNNPFYNSIWSLIKGNPKTSYTALSGLFSAPVLYSMFGGSEDTSSGIVTNSSNADINNYKLLANKAKQDINKEYANARKTNSNSTGVSSSTNTQSTTQNANNDLKQLNELSTRIDTNMAKLKALEEETLRRLQEQQAQAKQSNGSTDIGIFDTPDNYTPITPNNPMLPDTPILSNKSINNTTENVTNKPVDQGTTQGTNVPEKKKIPATDTNTSKNAIGNSIKKVTNQNAKKDTGSARVDTKYIPYTPVEIPGFNAAEHIKNNPEFAMPKQEFSNNTGSTSQPTKTALNESQSDYYRYLTGYRRMDPNQAILSMGLDPNKYYYQHDPAYYH